MTERHCPRCNVGILANDGFDVKETFHNEAIPGKDEIFHIGGIDLGSGSDAVFLCRTCKSDITDFITQHYKIKYS